MGSCVCIIYFKNKFEGYVGNQKLPKQYLKMVFLKQILTIRNYYEISNIL